MMHIGVLSTKIGVFCKNFALKFVTLQTNFGNFFFEFWRNLENICSLLLVSTKHFSAKSQKLKFPKIFHKIFHEIFHDFFLKKISSRILLPGIDSSLYKRSWDAWSLVGFKKFQNLFSNFWGVTNLSANFFQKMPIFVLRTSMCITYKILPLAFQK